MELPKNSIAASRLIDHHLSDLVKMNINSRDGFAFAAEKLKEKGSTLVSTFQNLSAQREQFAGEIQELMLEHHEPPPNQGTLAASLHRTWMGMRDMFASGADITAIIAEAERGEEYIRAAYEAALNDIADSETNATLRRHFDSVLFSYNAIKQMREDLLKSS